MLTPFDYIYKSQLKSALRNIKDRGTQSDEIRYVSKLLRSKISKSAKQDITTVDHASEISERFWSYCKRYLDADETKLPTFTKQVYQEFFKNSFKCIHRLKHYIIPSWIPEFNALSYKEVNKIIKRLKASGSPCLLDQISIICYKRYPYLRSYIHALCKQVWDRLQHSLSCV